MNKIELVAKAMTWKKSDIDTAKRLSMSLKEYQNLKQEVRDIQREEVEVDEIVEELQKAGFATGFTQDIEKGIAEYKVESSFQPRTAEEIENLIQLDKTKWKLSRYSVWNGGKEDVWLTSAKVVAVEDKQSDSDRFENFLKNYKPLATTVHNKHSSSKKKGALIINKQDAHLNKYDINGNNNIEERLQNVIEKVQIVLEQAVLHSHLEEVVYVLGSDLFNSEWTDMTTKGTPQTNALPYEEGFEIICNHEISVIDTILKYTDKIKIPFVAGNHDQFVGWHLISWLKMYYRNSKNVEIDSTTEFSKYYRYNNTGVMFNHGDAMKPEKLAQIFPIEFKKEWSLCDNYYIFSGDKHTEVSRDLGGIRFHQVPAWSKSNSKWDAKNGYTDNRAEVQGMYVSNAAGITTIYKEQI